MSQDFQSLIFFLWLEKLKKDLGKLARCRLMFKKYWVCDGERARGCMSEIHIHTRVTPERTSSKEIKLCPSLRSSYRSVMCFLTWNKCTGKIVGCEGVEGGKRSVRSLNVPLHRLNATDNCQTDSTVVTEVTEVTDQLWPPASAAMTFMTQGTLRGRADSNWEWPLTRWVIRWLSSGAFVTQRGSTKREDGTRYDALWWEPTHHIISPFV